jgi:hypothetical protein
VNLASGFKRFVLALVPLDERESGLVGVFLTAYFDESGTHEGSPVSVVAGYLATIHQWRVFETRWQKMLKGAKVNVFHMVDLEHSWGEFQGWSEEQRRKLIREATRIIRDQTEMGVGLATFVQDFNVTMTLPFQKWFGGIYGWCGWGAINIAARWAPQSGYTNPIHYIFEAGAKGRHELDHLIGDIENVPEGKSRYLIGEWGFQRKEDVVQLQAADFLSYEIFKNIINRDPTLNDSPMPSVRRSYNLLVRKTDKIGLIDEPHLLGWMQHAKDIGLYDDVHMLRFLENMDQEVADEAKRETNQLFGRRGAIPRLPKKP